MFSMWNSQTMYATNQVLNEDVWNDVIYQCYVKLPESGYIDQPLRGGCYHVYVCVYVCTYVRT